MHLAPLKLDFPFLEREEGIVAADADVKAGMKLRAALADDDRAGGHGLPAIRLDATVLRIGIAAVP